VYIIGFVGFIFGGLYWLLNKPPSSIPIKKLLHRWHTIYPDYKNDWERGPCTQVYINSDNEIRGKVVKTHEGLYLATMWNGYRKEFVYESDAKKSVEEYRVRIVK
jgi:hypothetical protein